MDLGLQGRIAIVTGGSDGIGFAAAESMLGEGANVAILARDTQRLGAAADKLRRAGLPGSVMSIPCDVGDVQHVEAAVAAIADRWSGVDVLVNNAGASSAHSFLEVDADLWEQDLRVKLYGAIFCSRAVIPHMRRRSGGRIINVTATPGKAPTARSVPTSVSRAAGIALTKALAQEYAPGNILVNTVCVGLIRSGQHRRRWEAERAARPDLSLEDWYSERGGDLPLGRLGEAQEVGDVICFLASSRASYVTGTAINVDGGRSPVI